MQKSCGAILYSFNEKNELLFLAIQSVKEGVWGFPKGHVESKETEIETAIREVWEETGYHIDITQPFREELRFLLWSGEEKRNIFFIAEVKEGLDQFKKQEAEIANITWGTFQEIQNLITFEDTKEILQKANTYLLQTK